MLKSCVKSNIVGYKKTSHVKQSTFSFQFNGDNKSFDREI